MSKIFIEKKEIKFKVQETVEESSFDVIDGKYVENTKLNRKYIADIYSYLDFNVLFAMENLFDEYYIKKGKIKECYNRSYWKEGFKLLLENSEKYRFLKKEIGM